MRRRALLEGEATRRALLELGPMEPAALDLLSRIVTLSRSGLGAIAAVARALGRPWTPGEPAGRRCWAVRALALGGDRDVALPVVIGAVGDPEPIVRLASAECLRYTTEVSPRAFGALKNALEDWNPRVRFVAAESLGLLAHATPAVVTTLAAGLSSTNFWTRERAAQALGSLGPKAIDSAPLLLDALLRESEPWLKAPLREAHSRITGNLVGGTIHGM
jgi:hypothetical protein